MEYSLLALVMVLCGALLWHADRRTKEAAHTSALVLEHARTTAAYLVDQQATVLAMVERIVNPTDRPAGRAEVTEEEIDAALGDVGWDPTDADPFLRDNDYAGFVPKQQFNDAPPIPTHPMGIPGLELPYGVGFSNINNNAETRVDL